LKKRLRLIKYYNIRGECRINFSLMRGLDYYTGIVFEYKLCTEEKSTIAGGGRYDTLIGTYGSKSLPVVGLALGVDRILETLNFSDSKVCTYAKVFVMCVKDSNYACALKIANKLRANGVATDINLATRNLSNQFDYANSLRFNYAIVVGDAEEKSGSLKLRNLVSGEEQTVSFDDALGIIKG
jgi:histidyl-tRNA synthetase